MGQVDFSCHDNWGCPPSHSNGLMRFSLNMSPFSKRDFCNVFALAKAADGSGYITFCRDCEHPAYTNVRSDRIQAQLHGNVSYIYRDPQHPGSTRIAMITKQDVKIGVIPHWLINSLVPSQMAKWKSKMQSVCLMKLKAYQKANTQSYALSGFFRPADIQARKFSGEASVENSPPSDVSTDAGVSSEEENALDSPASHHKRSTSLSESALEASIDLFMSDAENSSWFSSTSSSVHPDRGANISAHCSGEHLQVAEAEESIWI